jgi:hypothetical protein
VAARRKKIARKGFSSLLAIFFVTLFSVLAISFAAMSNVNVQMSRNHRDVSISQAAAESGLEYAKYLVNSYVPPPGAETPYNTVSADEASETFGYFAAHVQTLLTNSALLGGKTISLDTGAGQMRIPSDGGVRLTTDSMAEFAISFDLVTVAATEDEPEHYQLAVTSSGYRGDVDRELRLVFPIRKGADVLKYAVASRGRIWLTGDSTIHGDIFSDWDNLAASPFNVTSDSRIDGTVNTVLTKQQCIDASWQLETLDADGNPMSDGDGNRIYSSQDELQGYHEGVNYDQVSGVPGMDISDYNTDLYNDGLSTIPEVVVDDRAVEFFPHASSDDGGYSYPRDSTSYPTVNSTSFVAPDGSTRYTYNRKLDRHVYENQTFTDAFLPSNRNALFRNCTFEGILYVDCSKSGDTYYNNVRFEDCNFNGPIITDVPQQFKWKHNTLYFTGAATFQNEAMTEATILAPHFNVNLGNTNPEVGDNNILTGAIVGGIVDVRGNAEIYGTIISMCDTTAWTSGYVTNIGCTLDDGGSETTELGDIGVISITPDEEKMLPSGITTPVVIGDAQGDSYMEL